MPASDAQSVPALRLSDAGVASWQRRSTPATRPGSVAARSHANKVIEPTDARWVLAVRTRSVIEGGPAAVLAPERRESLVRLGVHLGLRAFDANVVIALVQDAVRRGEEPLGQGVADRLRMVHAPARATHRTDAVGTAISFGIVLMLGIAIATATIRWLLLG